MIYYENEINWNQREDEFIKLCEDIKSTNKNNEYDCVIAVSGGKDKYRFIILGVAQKTLLKFIFIPFID